MRGFVNVISRFEDNITLVRQTRGVHSGLGSPTVTAAEYWTLPAALLPHTYDKDTRSQGISMKSGDARLYVRLDALAKKQNSIEKKTVADLGLESSDEIIVNERRYLISKIVRYERSLGFAVADVVLKPQPGGV